MPGNGIYAMTANDKYVFVGVWDNSVWSRLVCEMLTSVKESPKIERPNSFNLEQNYPNPFNPTTNIQYALTTRQFVTIKVYNVLGKEITTLVNEEKPEGQYSLNFNAGNFPSGVYFYTIRAGNFIETKKMLLLK